MFRCDPTSFMRSISWRNCRFSSSPAFSKQKRELMNKRISVKISQEKQCREGLWTAYPCKESDDEGHHVLNQNVNVTKRAKFAALARRITDNLCLLQQYKWNTIKLGLLRLIINAPYGSSSMIILDFFISRRKNWPLFTGYFGSWGHALVAVAVEETFKQESLCRLSLETENSDRCREVADYGGLTLASASTRCLSHVS